MITEATKQTLIQLGFAPIKSYAGNGKYIGIRIYKNGEPAHASPVASEEIAQALIDQARLNTEETA